MRDERVPGSSIVLYQSEDGGTRIRCRFENETLWLTQKLIAELFQVGVNTVNHLLERAARGCREKFDRAMAKIPARRPLKGDGFPNRK